MDKIQSHRESTFIDLRSIVLATKGHQIFVIWRKSQRFYFDFMQWIQGMFNGSLLKIPKNNIGLKSHVSLFTRCKVFSTFGDCQTRNRQASFFVSWQQLLTHLWIFWGSPTFGSPFGSWSSPTRSWFFVLFNFLDDDCVAKRIDKMFSVTVNQQASWNLTYKNMRMKFKWNFSSV